MQDHAAILLQPLFQIVCFFPNGCVILQNSDAVNIWEGHELAKRSDKKRPGGLSRRLSFPDDEKRLSWLPALLDAYAVADTGVAIAIRDREKRQKKKLA